ncbi:MAG: hypothetical protein KBA26_08395 [Candidatus Delongbacteria bacterium]|nr:hypothetical protein [Candidatus Delongbacteria bacterium]
MMIIWRIMVMVMLLGWVHCNSKPREELKTMEFQVQDSLLEPVYTDTTLGIRFSPPKGCVPLDDSTMNLVIGQTEALRSQEMPGRLCRVFFSPQTRIMCFLSVLECSNESRMDSLWLQQAEHLAKLPSTTGHFTDHFLYKQFRVRQLMITGPDRIALKLLFVRSMAACFQLDYSIPAGIYQSEGHALESSIGSVSLDSSQIRQINP